jgi:hypothetical protein
MEELLTSEDSGPRGGFPWWKLAVAGTLIVLLVLAIVLPPLFNLGKYRHSLTASMSEALGRPVYVGGMQLRLLPMPGIVMSDFTVDEDPAFGYEPALHATSVVAALRLSSLWRGRLEVSRISLDEANLNLVGNGAGEWSIDSVLLRASQIPNAPTGERRVGAHPRFPYIEATDARIDFKNGAEKKPFSLMNAEFSMWQASGGEWRLRLRAQPVRTDLQLHLSEAGELRVEGSLRRAVDLNTMPVDLRAEWSGAQLGEVSRLMAGVDSGWRGDLDVTSSIQGSAGDLNMQSRVQIRDLRRQEFQPATTVDVDATCRSNYLRTRRMLDSVTCFWPIAAGHLLLTGRVHLLASPDADLQLEINQIPAFFPVTVLGLMRPNAQNVTATGTVNGNFRLLTGARRVFSGDATATGVSLRYPGGGLPLPSMHFVAPPTEPPQRKQRPTKRAAQRATVRSARAQAAPGQSAPGQNVLQLLPMSIAMGAPEPLVADARFTKAGFELHLAGQAALGRLIPVGANFGLLENGLTSVAPKGRATVNTNTAGNWMRPLSGASAGIGTTGTLKIEAAELRPGFLPAPVDVESAEIELTPEEISWQNVALEYQAMAMRGSIRFPAVCNQPVACPAIFTLAPGSLDAATVEAALGGNANSGFLGQLFTNALGGGSAATWPPLRGQIQCETLHLGQLTLRDLSASVSVEGAKLNISSLDGATLGGSLHASGEMTIVDRAPRWELAIRVADASAGDVAALFGEQWGTGQMSGETNLTLSGYRTADLASSASGDFTFTWQNGALPPAVGVSDTSLDHFDRWMAKGAIANGALSLSSGGLVHAARTSPLRGSISFDRDLDLTLETRRGSMKITGTLAQPAIH